MFHRSEQGEPSCYDAAFGTRCGSCGRDLLNSARFHHSDKTLLRVQRTFDAWLLSGSAIVNGKKVKCLDLFTASRALCRAVMTHAKRSRSGARYERFEMLGIDERADVLLACAPYVADLGTALQRISADLRIRASDVVWVTDEARSAFSRII